MRLLCCYAFTNVWKFQQVFYLISRSVGPTFNKAPQPFITLHLLNKSGADLKKIRNVNWILSLFEQIELPLSLSLLMMRCMDVRKHVQMWIASTKQSQPEACYFPCMYLYIICVRVVAACNIFLKLKILETWSSYKYMKYAYAFVFFYFKPKTFCNEIWKQIPSSRRNFGV